MICDRQMIVIENIIIFTMPERFFDNREHRFDITLPKDNDPILAVCPKCNAKALVFPNTQDTVKCVCTKCSFNNWRSRW